MIECYFFASKDVTQNVEAALQKHRTRHHHEPFQIIVHPTHKLKYPDAVFNYGCLANEIWLQIAESNGNGNGQTPVL